MTTAKRRQSTADMHAVRPILEERSAGYCEVCCAPLHPTENGYEAAHHHRKLRSRGGDDSAANALLCHHSCHDRLHARPGLAQDNGHIVASWDDPETTPLIYQGRSALLGIDGSVNYQDERSF